jgi:hypothetical protein
VLSKWLRSFSDHINIVFGLSRIGGEILFPELTLGWPNFGKITGRKGRLPLRRKFDNQCIHR